MLLIFLLKQELGGMEKLDLFQLITFTITQILNALLFTVNAHSKEKHYMFVIKLIVLKKKDGFIELNLFTFH